MTKLNPYINFRDNAKEAMEFYQGVFGGEVTATTFKDGGVPHDPADADKIMHSMLITPNGLTLMASDAPMHMQGRAGSNISLSVSGEADQELRGYWQKLSDGASITVPLEKAPWGDTFGMLTDKFGVDWMINITVAKQA